MSAFWRSDKPDSLAFANDNVCVSVDTYDIRQWRQDELVHVRVCSIIRVNVCVRLSRKVWQTQRTAYCLMCHRRMGPLWMCLTISLTQTQMNFPTTKTRNGTEAGVKRRWRENSQNESAPSCTDFPCHHAHSSIDTTAKQPFQIPSCSLCRHTHSHTQT